MGASPRAVPSGRLTRQLIPASKATGEFPSRRHGHSSTVQAKNRLKTPSDARHGITEITRSLPSC